MHKKFCSSLPPALSRGPNVCVSMRKILWDQSPGGCGQQDFFASQVSDASQVIYQKPLVLFNRYTSRNYQKNRF